MNFKGCALCQRILVSFVNQHQSPSTAKGLNNQEDDIVHPLHSSWHFPICWGGDPDVTFKSVPSLNITDSLPLCSPCITCHSLIVQIIDNNIPLHVGKLVVISEAINEMFHHSLWFLQDTNWAYWLFYLTSSFIQDIFLRSERWYTGKELACKQQTLIQVMALHMVLWSCLGITTEHRAGNSFWAFWEGPQNAPAEVRCQHQRTLDITKCTPESPH